jgi:hypothetical protein
MEPLIMGLLIDTNTHHWVYVDRVDGRSSVLLCYWRPGAIYPAGLNLYVIALKNRNTIVSAQKKEKISIITPGEELN